MMATTGLKESVAQGRFRRACEKVGGKIDVDVDFDTDSRADDAFEDDGCLHIRRHGLHAMFSIGQDTHGSVANEQTRAIMAAVGLKRKIGKRVLVEEECEACDGSGNTNCGECYAEHYCDDCDGTGFTVPEDYK